MKMKKIWALLIVIVLVALDQLSKVAAQNLLRGKEDFILIKNIFTLSYVENTGAAFSILTGKQEILIVITVIVLFILAWKYTQIPNEKKFYFFKACLILIISGAIGNFIDRVRTGSVVDFFYFVPIDFPKFNIADSYITVGVAMLLISLFIYKDKDFEGFISLKGWK